MIKKLLYYNLLASLSMFGGLVNAQEYCSFDEVNKRYLAENPQVQQMVNIAEREIALATKNGKLLNKTAGQIYEIPVVVHVFADKSTLGTLGNPSDAQIVEWIDFTNKLYANTYYSGNNSTAFPFRLVLAKRNPNCENTTGIVRFNLSNNQDYNDFGLKFSGTKGVTETELRQMSRWDPTSYYNIYVTNKIDGFNGTSGGGTNGYAYLFGAAGGDVDGAYHHAGVVGKDKPTLGHEFGHALGLYHTFGQENSTTACQTTFADDPYTTGDLVWDTAPTINGNYYYSVYGVSQPTSAIINGCTNEPFDNVVTNVMNYGSYRNKFTQGQVERSVELFLQYRRSLLNSKALEPIDNNNQITLTQSCIPNASTVAQGSYGYGMTRVQFGSIDVSSSPKDGTNNYYNDYSKSCLIKNNSTDILEGKTYELKLTERTPNAMSFIAYLDLNNDGVFTNDEILLTKSNVASETNVWVDKTHTYSVVIPNGAVKDTPLRLRIIGDSQTASFEACGVRTRGEIEDYAVTVKSNNTIWNGTAWSNGLPDATKEAIVKGDLSLSTNIVTSKLALESGSITVKANAILKVENEIINKLTADKFIIEDGGNVIQTNAVTNTGSFTAITNSKPMIFNDATLWSSPVNGQNVRSFSPNTLDKRFYIYNEQTNKFASLFVNDPLYPNSNLQNPATYNFENGLGYHIRVANNHTQTAPGAIFAGKFIGNLNNGNYTKSVTKQNLGYHLIGNPYPSSLDAKKFLQANPSVKALYFWTHQAPLTSAGYASNNYASYNLTGGTQAAAGGVIPNGIIGKGQGFIAEINAATTLKFDNTQRTDLSAIFYKNEDDSKRIWIDLFEGTQAKNQILIGYVQDATNEFDERMDAKLNQNYDGSAIYSLINNLSDRFVIQGRALPFNNDDTVKLGLDAKANASYTIQLNNTENIADDVSIFLYDKVDKQIVDLRKQAYTFNVQEGINNDRFELMFTNKTLGISNVTKQETVVFKKNNTIVIQSPKEIKSVEVYDISGRKVLSKSTSGKEITLSNLPKTNQVLVIKVINTDQTITNTKILF